jgi:hypothetical protein
MVRRREESSPAAFIFSLWQATQYWFRNARWSSTETAGVAVAATTGTGLG